MFLLTYLLTWSMRRRWFKSLRARDSVIMCRTAFTSVTSLTSCSARNLNGLATVKRENTGSRRISKTSGHASCMDESGVPDSSVWLQGRLGVRSKRTMLTRKVLLQERPTDEHNITSPRRVLRAKRKQMFKLNRPKSKCGILNNLTNVSYSYSRV